MPVKFVWSLVQTLPGEHMDVQTQTDSKTIRFNSRRYDQATGSSIGFQCKPQQKTTTTGDVIGGEISPRTGDVGAGALIALKADPVLQTATAARTVSAVRGVEVNIDFPDSGSAYTITNHVNAFRTFLDMGSGHTVSGRKSVFLIATPNTSGWQHLIESEAASGVHSVTAGTYSTADGYFNVYVAGTAYRVPFFAGVD